MFDVGGGRSPFSPLDGGWGCPPEPLFLFLVPKIFPFFSFFGIQVSSFSFSNVNLDCAFNAGSRPSRYYHEILALPDLWPFNSKIRLFLHVETSRGERPSFLAPTDSMTLRSLLVVHLPSSYWIGLTYFLTHQLLETQKRKLSCDQSRSYFSFQQFS